MRRRTKKSQQEPARLLDHIRELQYRLFACALVLVAAGVVVYGYYEPILDILRAPLDAPLYYSTPAGSFAFIMKICFVGGLAVTVPLIIYNLIMFIRPAYERKISRRSVYLVTLVSALLAFGGILFGYFVILPGSLKFFSGFQVDGLNAIISADSYLNYVVNILITFILAFQLPLVLGFIDRIKPLTPGGMLRMEKWVILGSLVVSLLVPFAFDFSTSMLISVPIIALYNLSVIMVLIRHAGTKMRRRQRRQPKVIEPDVVTPKAPETPVAPAAKVIVAAPPGPSMQPPKSFDIVKSSIPTPRTRQLVVPARPIPPRVVPPRQNYLISDIRPISPTGGVSPAST